MTEARSPFSEITPNFQVVWDSTSLGWLKKCPRYYQYTMLQQWTPRNASVHLIFGQLYAAGVERYARERGRGASHDEATLRMCKYVLSRAGERDEDGAWHAWEPPAGHPDAKIKNRYTLLRSLVWNVEERLTSPFKTLILSNGQPAVELSFDLYAFDIEGEPIHLSGHLDEVATTDGRDRWVADDKSTKSQLNTNYFQQYSPNNQMSLYDFCGRIILDSPIQGVMIRAAQILVEGTRFASKQVTRTADLAEEWINDTRYWIDQARSFAVNNYWPMNDMSCGNYGGCAFQDVCSVSPRHRKQWLQGDFIKHEWNPLEFRGET